MKQVKLLVNKLKKELQETNKYKMQRKNKMKHKMIGLKQD